MTEDYVIEVIERMMMMATMIAGPILVAWLIIGVIMGIVQSATQIQENSLTFLPKLAVFAGTVFFFGGWALEKMVSFVVMMISEIGNMGPGGVS